MKISMIIKYFKTTTGKVFYKYSLESEESIKKEKRNLDEVKLSLSNPELENESSEEISREDYDSIINKIFPQYVI